MDNILKTQSVTLAKFTSEAANEPRYSQTLAWTTFSRHNQLLSPSSQARLQTSQGILRLLHGQHSQDTISYSRQVHKRGCKRAKVFSDSCMDNILKTQSVTLAKFTSEAANEPRYSQTLA